MKNKKKIKYLLEHYGNLKKTECTEKKYTQSAFTVDDVEEEKKLQSVATVSGK